MKKAESTKGVTKGGSKESPGEQTKATTTSKTGLPNEPANVESPKAETLVDPAKQTEGEESNVQDKQEEESRYGVTFRAASHGCIFHAASCFLSRYVKTRFRYYGVL